MTSDELKVQVVADGVRVDKNIIPAYLTQLMEGQSNFSVDGAYYSGDGKTCQSGNCGKRINNVFILKDKTTGQVYEVGSECIKKYGNNLEQLIDYWKRELERSKRTAMWAAKKAMWASECDEKVRAHVEKYQKELEFINKYLEIKPSGFLESVQRIIEHAWRMTDKQEEALSKMVAETDFNLLQQQVEVSVNRFGEVLQMFEVLDKVKFGMYPSDIYSSLRDQFAKNGMLSDKQIALLQKLMHRFRKQIAVK